MAGPVLELRGSSGFILIISQFLTSPSEPLAPPCWLLPHLQFSWTPLPFLTSSTILHFVFMPTIFLAQEKGEQLVSVSFFDGSRSFLKFNPILLNDILMPSAPFVLSANTILGRYYVPHTAGSQSDFKNTTLSLYPC